MTSLSEKTRLRKVAREAEQLRLLFERVPTSTLMSDALAIAADLHANTAGEGRGPETTRGVIALRAALLEINRRGVHARPDQLTLFAPARGASRF